MTDTMLLKNELAVLVPSCDRYSDLWKPFFTLFWRFWPDCPYNVYLLSNRQTCDIPGIKGVLVGDDVSWSDTVRTGVAGLREDYILLFLEDLFLCAHVKATTVEKVLNWMLDSQANYVRLNPSVPPDKPCNDFVGVVSKGTIYRTSTVLSAWKKQTLLDLLRPGESAWEFETEGSVRSDSYDSFYSTWEECFPVINGVVKSKWRRDAVSRIRSLGVVVDVVARPVMTRRDAVMFQLKQERSKLLRLFPAMHRRALRDWFLPETGFHRKPLNYQLLKGEHLTEAMVSCTKNPKEQEYD